MKTNNKIDSTQIRYSRSFLLLICLLLVSIIFSGCLTTHYASEGIGKKAKIKFEILNPEMPNPMIHLLEYPIPNETALTLNPSLPGCEKLRFFANPTKSDVHELSDKLEKVELIKLRTEKDEQNLWNYLPSDQCSVLLTVGYGDFVGVSASTRSGVFKRLEISFQEDIESNAGALILATLAPFYDALYSPLYLTMGLAVSTAPAIEDVTVVFDFPDGLQKETKLTYDEASRILKNHFFHSDFSELKINPSRIVNFWLHAALIKLRLDFKMEGLPKDLDSPFWQARLKSVDKLESSWFFQIDNSTSGYDLNEGGLKSGSVLRFYAVAP
jgi:hypothetical protein